MYGYPKPKPHLFPPRVDLHTFTPFMYVQYNVVTTAQAHVKVTCIFLRERNKLPCTVKQAQQASRPPVAILKARAGARTAAGPGGSVVAQN